METTLVGLLAPTEALGSAGVTVRLAAINPVGWMADVAYVPGAQNRADGSSLGAALWRLCNGTPFRYALTS